MAEKKKQNRGLLNLAYQKFPVLRRYDSKFGLLQSADPGDGRQLEYYPPWETDNPMPGQATIEMYNTNEAPGITQNLIAGDMLHYLGSVDPNTQQPVDPTFYALKQHLLSTMTPRQDRINREAYEGERKFYDNPPSYEDWMQDNRGDAYIRGLLTPDADNNWRNIYTPEQRQVLGLIGSYLAGNYKTGAR